MSDENRNEQNSPARDESGVIQQTFDTFEVSTAEVALDPAAQLLAEYANPVAGDSVIMGNVMVEDFSAVAETPAVEVARSEPEVAEAPVVEAPVVEAPVVEAPVVEAPVVEAPVVEAPVVEAPVVEAPVVEAPVVEAPVVEAPVVEAPVVEDPVVEDPVVEAPVAEAPVAEAPVAEAPVAEAPVAEAPVAEAPVAEAPVAEAPKPKAKKAKKPVSDAQLAENAKAAGLKPAVDAGPKFTDLALHEGVQQAILKSGYDTPTPIQAEIIPHMLEGRDVLAQSQTGSGKTAAFAMPILSRIKLNRGRPQVLVLAPTRELAIQVAKSFSTYASCMPGFNVAAIYGGQDYEPQLRMLRRGVQVVVGTPGRVIDHVKRGSLDLGGLTCLALDEADEMLNMGFLEDVQFVLKQTPADRQVALFSATLPPAIQRIAQDYLNDPVKITIKKKTMTADSIRQRALFVAPRDKVDVLKRILEAEETDGVIVFTKTKDATVQVAEQLVREGLSAVALNGDMPQKVRERAIDQLKSGRLNILVATDVAARGLDVTRISHVFNFDLPHDTESYIHRVGRTGRAGRKGEAVIFLTNAQRGKLRMIERATKQTIQVVNAPTADEINARRVEQFKQSITAVAAEQDLTLYKELITDYLKETDKPIELVAAALAHLSQGGRPFLMRDRPARKKREDFDSRDRGSNDSFDRRESRPQREGGDRRSGPPEAGMSRYRIEVGWNDGVKPGNIVGAVANEAGIDGEYIGPIKINDSFSLIDLPEGMPADIFLTLQTTWVSGKQLKISEDRGPSHVRPRSGGYQGGNKRNSKPRPGGKSFSHGGGKPKHRKRKTQA